MTKPSDKRELQGARCACIDRSTLAGVRAALRCAMPTDASSDATLDRLIEQLGTVPGTNDVCGGK